MSHDFFRNRSGMGSIPQLSPVVPTFFLTKNLTFASSAELTDNFTQALGTGASQNVASSLLQFRNANYDQNNGITAKWTMTKMLSFKTRALWYCYGSSASYNYPTLLTVDVLNASNVKITTFRIIVGFNYTYYSSNWEYWNSGYTSWQLGTDPMNQSIAIAKRLATAPSQNAFHDYEVVDVGGGYVQYKLDGVNTGAPMYLGDPTYKLGGVYSFSPLGGWYNNQMNCDVDSLIFTYL